MEQIQNHKSVDSQPIWLKSVRSEVDSVDLTNPWLKEVIKSDPEMIFSILYGELHPLSLLHTCGLSWKLCGLMCQLNQPPDWQVGLVRLHISIDCLSLSCSGLSPWDLRLPWVGSPVFYINKAQAASSKLVRFGLRSCCHCNTTIFLLWIKKLWRLYCVVHVFVWIPSVMLLMW